MLCRAGHVALMEVVGLALQPELAGHVLPNARFEIRISSPTEVL